MRKCQASERARERAFLGWPKWAALLGGGRAPRFMTTTTTKTRRRRHQTWARLRGRLAGVLLRLRRRRRPRRGRRSRLPRCGLHARGSQRRRMGRPPRRIRAVLCAHCNRSRGGSNNTQTTGSRRATTTEALEFGPRRETCCACRRVRVCAIRLLCSRRRGRPARRGKAALGCARPPPRRRQQPRRPMTLRASANSQQPPQTQTQTNAHTHKLGLAFGRISKRKPRKRTRKVGSLSLANSQATDQSRRRPADQCAREHDECLEGVCVSPKCLLSNACNRRVSQASFGEGHSPARHKQRVAQRRRRQRASESFKKVFFSRSLKFWWRRRAALLVRSLCSATCFVRLTQSAIAKCITIRNSDTFRHHQMLITTDHIDHHQLKSCR